MSILVIGGTGMVGREVVNSLLARGATPRVMTRNPADQAPREGVTFVAGDLAQPDTLPAAFDGVEKIYLLTPLDPREADLGIAGIGAAVKAGVKLIVFQSIHKVHTAAHVPHFKSKIEIAAALADSGVPHTLISPNNFHQNDLMFREAMLEHGVYPQPFGSAGMSRVDVRDIGEVAAIVLLGSGHEGRDYPLVGPHVLTAPQTAAMWARHLGREIAYGGDDLDAWASQAGAMLPGWLVEDLRAMYEVFQDKGLTASSAELDVLRDVLGAEPRSFDAFAEETARAWLAG